MEGESGREAALNSEMYRGARALVQLLTVVPADPGPSTTGFPGPSPGSPLKSSPGQGL